jgi:hypothetical protein
MNRKLQNLVTEIHATMAPKLHDIQNGTASQRKKDICNECQGFISLLKYSSLPWQDIKRLWDESNLKYM